MLFPLSLISILVTLAVVLVCCYIMARFRQVFDRIKLPIAALTVLGGLTLYTIGYLPEIEPADQQNQVNAGTQYEQLDITTVSLRAVYSTARIFLLEGDLNDVKENLRSNSLYVFALSLVHALGVMLTIMTLLSFIGIKFLSHMKLFFAGAKQVYIFLGLNEASENLIKSLRENGKSRCFIVVENIKDKEEDSAIVRKLREDRFILLDLEWTELKSLRKMHIPGRLFKSEVHVFALSSEENKNIRVILNMLRQSKKDKISDQCLYFYANSSDEGIERILETTNIENETHYEFKVFSHPDLAARQLFDTYPIHDYITMDSSIAKACSDFNIFIAGLGTTGVEILRKSIYLGQFMGGDYRAILADREISRIKGQLLNRYPGLKTNYRIESHEADPGSEAFYDILENNIQTLNYIVVSFDDDRLNMETAIEIQRLLNRTQISNKPIIAVQIRQHEEFQHLEQSGNHPDIRFFGRSSDIFTESIIINECMDKMARRMNALFNSIYHIDPADNWDKLDAFTKESNRSAALNIATKLRLLGLEMAEKEEKQGATAKSRKLVDLKNCLVGEKLDNLARQEHLRWNAFHFASGWTTWDLGKTGGAKKAKDLLNKRHACLVSWDDLEKVTRHFNQNPTYQDLDYEQVKNLPMILDYAGYEVFEKE